MFENLGELDAYIYGFGECSDLLGNESASSEWIEFREWLRELGYFPCEGWTRKIAGECQNSEESFSRFSDFLYEYLKIKRPKWFVDFNKQARESRWRNEKGPRSKDIRKKEHIEWITNA